MGGLVKDCPLPSAKMLHSRVPLLFALAYFGSGVLNFCFRSIFSHHDHILGILDAADVFSLARLLGQIYLDIIIQLFGPRSASVIKVSRSVMKEVVERGGRPPANHIAIAETRAPLTRTLTSSTFSLILSLHASPTTLQQNGCHEFEFHQCLSIN